MSSDQVRAFPKLFHQTFSSFPSLPPLYKKCHKILKTIYSDYKHFFYSDSDIDFFMNKNFESFKKNVFDKLPAKIMKIDTFRYCLMYLLGGVYADLDYQPTKRFNFDEHNLVLPISYDKNGTVFGNCIFSSIPQHPLWRATLDELTQNIDVIVTTFPGQSNPSEYKKYILNTTGPNFLTNVFKKYCIDDTSIYLPPKHFFHPNTPKTEDEVNALTCDPENFGFHHCTGIWLYKRTEKRRFL